MIANIVRKSARRLLIMTARDWSCWPTPNRLMVVAPHPDDETLGCAGAMTDALRGGSQVTVVVLTDGARAIAGSDMGVEVLRAERSRELDAAMAALSVSPERVLRLGFHDGELAVQQMEVDQRLAALIEEFQPERILVTCREEWHRDHAAAAHAVLNAVSIAGSSAEIWEYPIWLWADWPLSRRVRAREGLGTLLRLAAGRRAVKHPVGPFKHPALACYQTQLRATAAGDGLPTVLVRQAIAGPEIFFRW